MTRIFWRFECNHIGGEIGTIHQEGISRAKVLLLYEQSLAAEPDRQPILRGRLEGSMLGIRCTICGQTRDWIIGEEALQELLRRRAARLQSSPSVL